MVRVTNIFGDVTTGRSGEAVYQRKYGRGMRRVYKEVKPSSSSAQLDQQSHFKDTIAWIKTLNYQQKEAVREYCRVNKIGNREGDPIHWYNFLKNLGLKKPVFKILDSETGKYSIKHNAILQVEEVDSSGEVLFSVDDLSDVLDSRYLSSFSQTPPNGTAKIRLTILPGLVYEYDNVVSGFIDIEFPCPS